MIERISYSFNKNDWILIRNKLRDHGIPDENWRAAIKLIYERVSDRYFKPLKILLDFSQSYKGVGFSIATIECSLIEFIASLYEGKVFLKDKKEDAPLFYYNDSASLYCRFLKSSTAFRSYFSAPKGQSPSYTASDFYKHVRCALIHEAQTKNNWQIKIFSKSKSKDFANRLVIETDNSGKKIVYRTALFFVLRDFFEAYCHEQLMDHTNKGRVLRRYLARKIDYLVEIKPDDKFWWKK